MLSHTHTHKYNNIRQIDCPDVYRTMKKKKLMNSKHNEVKEKKKTKEKKMRNTWREF